MLIFRDMKIVNREDVEDRGWSCDECSRPIEDESVIVIPTDGDEWRGRRIGICCAPVLTARFATFTAELLERFRKEPTR